MAHLKKKKLWKRLASFLLCGVGSVGRDGRDQAVQLVSFLLQFFD